MRCSVWRVTSELHALFTSCQTLLKKCIELLNRNILYSCHPLQSLSHTHNMKTCRKCNVLLFLINSQNIHMQVCSSFLFRLFKRVILTERNDNDDRGENITLTTVGIFRERLQENPYPYLHNRLTIYHFRVPKKTCRRTNIEYIMS